MLNEEIIRKEAIRFAELSINIESPSYIASDEQKNNIRIKLLEFNTSKVKSIFLDEIKIIVNQQLIEHRNKKHNGQSDENCPFERVGESLLFYIQQKIDELLQTSNSNISDSLQRNKNTMATQAKEKLLELISDGKIQEAIDNLLATKMSESSKKEASAISARYKELKRQKNLGILSFEQETTTTNQIINSLIDMINQTNESSTPPKKSNKISLNHIISAVALLATILGGFAEFLGFIDIFPSKKISEKLQLTVFITDTNGNVVLENKGRLNIPLGNRSLNESIGTNGRTNFPDITSDNKGDTITIGLDAEGWEIDGKNTFVFTGEPIRLRVKKDNSLGTIKGIVKSRDGQEFIEGATVLINTDTSITTDKSGIFKIILLEKMQVKKATDTYLLTVSKEGYKTKTQYYNPKSSDAEIRLEK